MMRDIKPGTEMDTTNQPKPNDHAYVSALYRYPVKGLSAQALNDITVKAGACFPGDRLFAIENGPSGFDPKAPAHLPKIKYLMLARNNELARLKTTFDDRTRRLTLMSPHGKSLEADIDSAAGRAQIEGFFSDYMPEALRGAPKWLEAPGHQFMDSKRGFASLINLASLRAIEKLAGTAIDPLRFRANIYVEGLAPWQEFDLIGQRLRLGEAEFIGDKRTDRCAATHVNPTTGHRDIDMLSVLERNLNHHDCGIYLRINQSGRIARSDRLTVLGPAREDPFTRA